jgi:hypothetical protein
MFYNDQRQIYNVQIRSGIETEGFRKIRLTKCTLLVCPSSVDLKILLAVIAQISTLFLK